MPDSDKSLPPAGATLSNAFAALIETFDERSVRYAIIGGLASIQYGRVRITSTLTPC